MKPGLFFIAIIPDAETCKEVQSFKTYALKHFESGRALRSPAHITLEPPFKWPLDKADQLEQKINAFAAAESRFQIQLNGFNTFAPKVIFINVLYSKRLFTLQQKLTTFLRSELSLVSDRPDRSYHPHMTVAFKDLRKSMFPKAWDYFLN